MTLSDLSIRRPVLATVMSLCILLNEKRMCCPFSLVEAAKRGMREYKELDLARFARRLSPGSML